MYKENCCLCYVVYSWTLIHADTKKNEEVHDFFSINHCFVNLFLRFESKQKENFIKKYFEKKRHLHSNVYYLDISQSG